MGPLESWAIKEDHPTPSDHEVIIFQWLNKEETVRLNSLKEVTGWDIAALLKDIDTLEQAKASWEGKAKERDLLGP